MDNTNNEHKRRYLSAGDIENILTTVEIEPVSSVINHNYSDEASLEVTLSRGKKCPHCGESYYMENHSSSTAMYFPPIYKNGVNINPDRNITTTYCTCMNCGQRFSYNSNGEINTMDFIDRCDAKVTCIDFTDEDVKNLFG